MYRTPGVLRSSNRRLPAPDGGSLLDLQGCTQTVIVVPEQRDPGDRGAWMNALLGSARYGEVEPSLDSVHTHVWISGIMAQERSMRPKIPNVRDIMSRSLVTLRPDVRVVDAAGVLLKHEISGAPVVDGEGKLLGLLSEYDCLRVVVNSEYDFDNRDAVTTVAEIMTEAIESVSPELDLFGLAHEFVTKRVRRFPVLEGGRLIGQVSRRDALRAAYDLRRKTLERKRYPDYPEGREPIHFYPRRSR